MTDLGDNADYEGVGPTSTQVPDTCVEVCPQPWSHLLDDPDVVLFGEAELLRRVREVWSDVPVAATADGVQKRRPPYLTVVVEVVESDG